MLYIDAVNPWQYGIPKPPLFCLEFLSSGSKRESLEDPSHSDATWEARNRVEDVPTDAGSPVIRVVGVTHYFGPVRAVDNLSVDIYANQITVLLGHNGAGKTTVMNIMTGLFPPTKGDITINEYSIREETKKAQRSVGLCPQHNVLFDYLTVGEHLLFFAKLKGSKSSSMANEIDVILEKIDLLPKRHDLSVNLSGGMKRKLCLANAIVGRSKVIHSRLTGSFFMSQP